MMPRRGPPYITDDGEIQYRDAIPYEPLVNWGRLASYFDDDPPPAKLDPLPRGFRLIDIETMSVVRMRVPSDYICLSYVWGDVQAFQATTKNIGILEKPGALDDPELPATIRDAIIACRKLGQRFLWVDRLCILQDDSDGTKQVHIDEMGRIYHHAFVTLVAHEGMDAGHGLHGVSDCLKLKPSDDGVLPMFRNSKWARRGWTYQEAALSHRLIYFAAPDAFFDGSKTPRWKASHPSNILVYAEQNVRDRSGYEKAVEDYTVRELGDQKDALNAFTGVFRHFFGKEHRFGIPTNGFDNVIHWMAVGHPRERRSMFPSWSWASIRGQVKIPKIKPVIAIASWAFVDIDQRGNFFITWPRPQVFSFKEINKHVWSFYEYTLQMAAAVESCKHGCMLMTPPGIMDMDLSSPTFEKKFAARWPSYARFWKACRGISSNQPLPQHIKLFSRQQKKLASKPGRILVVSQAASFSVRSIVNDGDLGKKDQHRFYYRIRNGEELVGVGSFDDLNEEELLSTNTTFMALSCSFEKSLMPLNILPNVSVPHGIFDDFEKLVKEKEEVVCAAGIVRVFAIRATEEDGVYRRIGTGFIGLKKWAEQQPEHHAFVLE
ncbi:heterokaryon incompatibility protein-domain-containing protein [Phyllosticta paracitricarpa]|uniref:Heterokaryon incompatibility protein-domain-containing protein n=1 Tax=Phyllosticta paracitricarpa TaxID=2016321 RepID=A0ABR1NLC8_9PEZI